MDPTTLTPEHLFGMFIGGVIVIFTVIFILLKLSFWQQKEIQNLKKESIDSLIDRIDRDLKGIGNKAREVEATAASLKATIAKLDFQHEKLVLSLEYLKVEIQNISISLDRRITDLVKLEIYHPKT